MQRSAFIFLVCREAKQIEPAHDKTYRQATCEDPDLNLSDRMCLPQSLDYPKRDVREPESH